MPEESERVARLDLLKTLGDNTRYAIYLELARSSRPLATADIAASLGLHVNTVRPHLERMRDVGLLEVAPETNRGVGRPQHLYSLAPDAPSLGLEPDRARQRLVSTVEDELPSWLEGLRVEGVRAFGRNWVVSVDRGRVTISEGV